MSTQHTAAGAPGETGADDGPERVTLWTPSPERVEASELRAYQRWLRETRGVRTESYQDLLDWSLEHLEDFWESIWEYFDVIGTRGDGPVLTGDTMPDVRWFPGARVNYAQNILRRAATHPDDEAIVGLHETNPRESLTWAQLEGRVGALAAWLRAQGVCPGDTVCAVLPSIPAAAEALLACASIGAVWSVVGPDFGVTGIVDRFAQIEPKVLITVDGYEFNGKRIDMRAQLAQLLEALPSVTAHLLVDQLGAALDAPATGEPAGEARGAEPRAAGAHTGAQAPPGPAPRLRPTAYSQVIAVPQAPEYEATEFSHPLWVLYSSGTTGKPKGIVHGHGGIVLESLKANRLQQETVPGGRHYSAVATTWVVWNLLINSLLSGTTIVVYDGSPVFGAPDKQFEICGSERVTNFGTGAAILTLIERSGLSPDARHNLSALRSILSTGSPLPDSTWEWAYAQVADDIHVGSDSGGTDIATGFIGSNPFDPIVRGELQGAYLGVEAAAFDSHGRPVIDEVGEFVVTRPMPSMPVMFWNDPDGERYRSAYFDVFPGVWRHGDWVTKRPGGQYVIHGRSDSTINRGGIRMGSADITQVVDRVPGVQASMVIGAELADGGYYMPLFVVPAPGVEVDEELRGSIVAAIRSEVSPRYVPDEIIAAPAVPVTRTGKLLEIPIKRVLQGGDAAGVNRATAADPQVLDWYVDFASAYADRGAER
ncbi:acetoacetate--CoA ligase [Brevibacterium sp. 5221]|uniref:Acetoacetate--CoA ligase n=1 Tax=Brevibacterium rongguiense TaxID=2695267 RepID=A0A6N9H8H5_9MICO|nr:acetoacetate--CoA ligase [Brevibacterium rongguiense]MYM19862.1 acetoacetate--CoA ligase [Brevibacterium rongguiense]